MVHAAHDDRAPARRIDDCWNRIGTRGDGTCPRLAAHARCLNCPVFAQAAATLLDRPLSDADFAEAARTAHEAHDTHKAHKAPPDARADDANAPQTALAFRIADEWLGLPVPALRQIDGPRPIHPLPHRRNGVVLGLVNVRGTLTIAASLGALLSLDLGLDLGLEHDAAGRHAPRHAHARLLVVEHRGDTVALPVDEVEGVLRFAASALLPAPTTLAHAATMHTRGLLAWRDTTLGLLDADRVFDSLARSLR
ncbi:chemotaxis protein CheW [Burkholderia ubonensis]|uniref:chemotaxis protein CheW n=1 Tax=Burkholderia ubonensis TaxID=101571 RepID=UPI00075A9C5E|nr:chemotaxis protein CheW [Burkholderia ubonensis]KVH77843.1 chemotaxis protein CheW [Burkholderia ubonensis]KVO18131.1 chemotaxis protein CheW [Burkholderia ubonensis]KVO33659.1 chemotaxis protein CheW [Burkholderia ubonensis]KVP24661.1 chemotaxis protein CheW [Burkholderia ubonensis]KVT96638.1 chemotaxis protein CheW [Burkholderia ubonensis]